MDVTEESQKRLGCIGIVRRVLILVFAVIGVALVGVTASQLLLRNHAATDQPTHLRRAEPTSWMSFNKQTGSLGLTPIDVETVHSPKLKQMELQDPTRTELVSDDEQLVIQVIEHRDPDLSESGKDEFTLKFEGDEEYSNRDVEKALSHALKSGLHDSNEISKAVSEELRMMHKKAGNEKLLPDQDAQKDKP